jgi:hypothetical protein
VLGEAGLRRATPGPDRANRGQASAPGGWAPGQGRGVCAMPTPRSRRRAVPRQDAAGTARLWRHDPRWPVHCRIMGCQVVRGITLFDNRVLGSSCCAGRGGPSPTLEVLVVW